MIYLLVPTHPDMFFPQIMSFFGHYSGHFHGLQGCKVPTIHNMEHKWKVSTATVAPLEKCLIRAPTPMGNCG
ncbi:hypothetical protein XELAEV_18006089mg [Xenopus laevis]|uniref:Uncharacterized protein n=1 Tax=Xenopus laevis TaxID=8355 RepID=A0A974DYJ2_XENLA|nr:hypothetical protein XELAEV_18006089mg [Xenopus laevis]